MTYGFSLLSEMVTETSPIGRSPYFCARATFSLMELAKFRRPSVDLCSLCCVAMCWGFFRWVVWAEGWSISVTYFVVFSCE